MLIHCTVLHSMHASKLKEIVDQYMESNQRISRLCKSIAEILLVQIDSKTLRLEDEFAAEELRQE